MVDSMIFDLSELTTAIEPRADQKIAVNMAVH
jgi:hypothetical protein